MDKSETRAISFRIGEEKLRKLEELAEATDRSRSWHIEQALDAYLDVQAWQLDHIKKGIASIREGRVVPHEKVREWLLSWGKDDESEPPL
jgi:predicted transcriptional regulator